MHYLADADRAPGANSLTQLKNPPPGGAQCCTSDFNRYCTPALEICALEFKIVPLALQTIELLDFKNSLRMHRDLFFIIVHKLFRRKMHRPNSSCSASAPTYQNFITHVHCAGFKDCVPLITT